MNIKRILLTGDDGYNSVGTRLLVHFLKKEYQLCIAATKNQQSGVGGKKTIGKKLACGKDVVAGVPAIWVDGTPVDCIECAKKYFKNQFDLVISGINFGLNVSGALISSGTFSAAFHAVNLEVAPYALALSFDVPAQYYVKAHDKDTDLRAFMSYPGEKAYNIIRYAIRQNLWGAKIININFPSRQTNRVVMTNHMETMYGLWPVAKIDRSVQTYIAPIRTFTRGIASHDTDVHAIENSKISLTPCQSSMLDVDVYHKIKRTKFRLI